MLISSSKMFILAKVFFLWICFSSIALAMPPRRDPGYDGNCSGSGDCQSGQRCHVFQFPGKRPLQLCLTPSPLGGECADIHFRVCQSQLQCVNPENKTYGRCVKYVAVGRACNKNLLCRGDCRQGKCTALEVGEGEFCSNLGTRCKSGLQCVAHSVYKRCVAPQSEGGICDYPFWVCRRGLQCRMHVCRT